MAQRASGSVTLCWGLISIPIKLYNTASEQKVSFKQITPEGNLSKQLISDSVTGEIVDRSTLRKGYEHKKGEFVIFTEEEVKGMNSGKKVTADLAEFVPAGTVDIVRIEKSMYAAPDKGADKAYLLLSAALKKKGMVGVAKMYSRGKEHLIVIAPRDDGLIIHQMYYEKEAKKFDNPCAKLPLMDQEIELACSLIEQGKSKAFNFVTDENASIYRDNYIDRVNEAVQAKLSGKKVNIKKDNVTPLGGDLLGALQASLKPSEVAKNVAKAKAKAS